MTTSSAPPFLLIRVQDALHGAHAREEGLFLPYRRDGVHGAYRNTSHWAVNAVVADHAYGSFNRTADGALKGAVVIVADPRDLPTPAGLGQVDTWFRLDATPGPDGLLDRGLSVGPRAVVIVPEGLEVPDGLNVVRYDGTLEQRDAAVAAVVAERGVALETAGMWGWSGSPETSTDWAQRTAEQHYPGLTGAIHHGSHTGSVDDALENGVRLEGLLERFATERLFERDDGVQLSMAHEIRRVATEQQDLLTGLLDGLSPVERARVGAFYDGQRQRLDGVEQRTQALETVWQRRLDAAVEPAALVLPPPLPGVVPGSLVLPPPLPDGSALPPPLPGATGWVPKGLSPASVDTWRAQREGAAVPPPLSRPQVSGRRFGG